MSKPQLYKETAAVVAVLYERNNTLIGRFTIPNEQEDALLNSSGLLFQGEAFQYTGCRKGEFTFMRAIQPAFSLKEEWMTNA